MRKAECVWKQDNVNYCPGDYDTSCGNRYIIMEGTPEENDMKFCCFCGKKLVQVLYVEEPLEDEDEKSI